MRPQQRSLLVQSSGNWMSSVLIKPLITAEKKTEKEKEKEVTYWFHRFSEQLEG